MNKRRGNGGQQIKQIRIYETRVLVDIKINQD